MAENYELEGSRKPCIMYVLTIFLTILINLIICRDFYVGMFKSNDILVAQDRLYKEKIFYSSVTAKYGRIFECPITYFRIVDRLGVGRGPKVEILRGGLQKNYIVLRLTSVYNYPISVNVYVGCENKVTQAPTKDKNNVKSPSTDKIPDVTTPVATSEATTVSSTDTSKDNKIGNDTNISNATVANNGTSANTTKT